MSRFALIGYPVAHSLSPRLFSAAYSGQYPYELVESPDFEQAWAKFLSDYDAINVTAPFKELAHKRADILSPEVERIGASNLCVKTDKGIVAYNSDYRGLKSILARNGDIKTAAVIGFGGAGKAALAAAEDVGLKTRLYRHNGIAAGVESDVIIYTLPRWVEGADKLACKHLIEANYKDPVLEGYAGYISGRDWLIQQAVTGYELMTGKKPDAQAISSALR